MNLKNLLISFCCFVSLQACFSDIPGHPDDIKVGSVKVTIPQNPQTKLSNGLTLIFQSRKELPLVSGSLFIPKGSAHGTCGIPGLNSFAISQMREGGTKSLSPNDVDEFLDRNAATVEFSQGEEFSTFSFSSLSQDFEEVFQTFSDLVQYPRFDEKRLDLSKQLIKEEISRRKDDPEVMASLAFSSVLYGKDSPWYQPINKKSLNQITKSEIIKYHKSFLYPEGSFLIVSGDIDENIFLKEAEKRFGSWRSEHTGCNLELPKVQNSKLLDNRGVYFLNRDFAQSTLILGNAAPNLKELNVYNLNIFNRVFGSGSFDSVLFKEIRDKRGLAYGVSGGISATANRGIFSVNLATRSKATTDAILGIENVVDNLRKEGFSENDISGALNSSKQSFVFKFSNPDYAVSRPAILKLSGYPLDYDESFLENISQVKGESLKDFFNSVNSLENMIVVIVGKIDPDDLKAKLGNKYRYCELAFDELPEVKECIKP